MNIYNKSQFKLILAIFILFILNKPIFADYSIGIGYKPKYPDNFQNFEYAHPYANKGGVIKLSAFGTFESLNPFLLKSLAPAGMNNLMFETLMERSLDEPSSSYGHIASGYKLSQDKMSVIYYIKDNAKFSNGDKISAQDVEFSFLTLISKYAHPQYKIYWSDIKSTQIIDSQTIKFLFKKKNPELHMIIGDIPIFSKKWFNNKKFNEVVLEHPIASGPYIIDKFEPGRFIEYKKNPKYWGEKEILQRYDSSIRSI